MTSEMPAKIDPTDREIESMEQKLFPRGRKYAGQPYDTSSRHSIQMVGDDANVVEIRAHDQSVIVDYLYHEGTYWRARIPLDGVQHIFAEAFNFSKVKTRPGKDGPELVVDHQGVPKRSIRILNHVQCRFVFHDADAIELYALGSDPSGEPAERIGDIVYSIEAVGPLGVRFNIADGMWGNLISAHRILSTRQMVFERIVVENMYVLESPALPLDKAMCRVALAGSLERSHRAGMTETYYLYRCCGTNNCTSNPLNIVDRIANYSALQRLGSHVFRLPLNPRFYLRVRGLDSDPTVRRLLRTEFRDYIGAPETVARKRLFVRQRTKALRAARDVRQ